MIESRDNATIKAIRKLSSRKGRSEQGCFLVEGIRIVAEAIQCGVVVDLLIVAPELLNSEFALNLVSEQQKNGRRILEVSANVFQSLSLKENPQGIAAVVRKEIFTTIIESRRRNNIWVALDAIQDPGNLGTIIRTLDAVGGNGLLLLDNSTDPFDPQAVRASMGAIFSIDIFRLSFMQLLEWKRCNGNMLVGATGDGKAGYRQVLYPSSLILLMGSEKEGLSSSQKSLCDRTVYIPMIGRSDSLNLAIATSIILYEIFHQHHNIFHQAEI